MDGNIVVLRFEGESQAENMLSIFGDMQDKGIVTLEDAVIATRGPGDQIEIKQSQSVTGKYTLRGSGIGLLAGMLLGGPVGGLVGGTVVGALAGALKDVGIDDRFIRQTSEMLTPGSSALFLMGKADDPDRFLEELQPFKALVATTSLSENQEKRLRSALSEDELW
jgi:uncharacterized membrane protein